LKRGFSSLSYTLPHHHPLFPPSHKHDKLLMKSPYPRRE
jgi:hypothetical protein